MIEPHVRDNQLIIWTNTKVVPKRKFEVFGKKYYNTYIVNEVPQLGTLLCCRRVIMVE